MDPDSEIGLVDASVKGVWLLHASFPSSFSTGILFVLLLVVLLFVSFVVSGAEVAFFSLSKAEVQKLQKDYRGKKIAYLLSHPKELLASLIIANTIVNLFVILVINLQLAHLLKQYVSSELYVDMIKLGIEIFVLILFAEILPKMLASKQNVQFAFLGLPLVLFFFKIFHKVSLRLNKLSHFIEQKFSVYSDPLIEQQNHLDELKHAIEITSDKEEKKQEIRFINAIMEFKNTRVKQVMKSRIDIKAIPLSASFAQIKKDILDFQYSKIPVYKDSLDNIVGILHTKKLLPHLSKKSTFAWRSLIEDAMFVLENQYVENCLLALQDKKVHLAIVVDEFGITQGLISFEDIVEEVVGEIKDEFDEQEVPIHQIDLHTFECDAKISIQDFAKYLDIPVLFFEEIRKNSDSLSGLLLELFQQIPHTGQSITWEMFTFTVLRLQHNRIVKVRIQIQK